MTELTDARALHEAHPNRFEIPPDFILKSLEIGDFVKVAASGERFWVEVQGQEGETIRGTVANRLVFVAKHGLDYGDALVVEHRHVYDVHPVNPPQRH
jgi:hypothetical protein